MADSERDPEIYWTDMSDSEWQAQHAPWSAGWLATLARNTECHKRVLYGTGSYTGEIPHDHMTGESAPLSPAVGVNLVQASCPATTLTGGSGLDLEDGVWTASGFTIALRVDVGIVATFGEDSRAVEGGTRGGYITQRLMTLGGGKQAQLFGQGVDLVCAVFARVTKASSRGTLQFGLSSERDSVAVQDASSSLSVEGPGEFGPRASGVIHYTDLNTSWKRFFIRIKNAGTEMPGDVRLTLSVLQSFSEKVQLSGFTATPGRRLYPWSSSPGDVPKTPAVFGHAGWQNMPEDIPLLDWAVSMDNAIELEPI